MEPADRAEKPVDIGLQMFLSGVPHDTNTGSLTDSDMQACMRSLKNAGFRRVETACYENKPETQQLEEKRMEQNYDRDATIEKVALMVHRFVDYEANRAKAECRGMLLRDGGRAMSEAAFTEQVVDAVFLEASKDMYALTKELGLTTEALVAERKKVADLEWHIAQNSK